MTGMTLFGRRTPSRFDDFRREFDSLFRDFFDEGNGSHHGGLAMFNPQANVAESEKDYEVTLDLPGMKPEEVNIELHEGHLVVSGERKHEHEEQDKTWHRIERSYGSFRRVIPLDTAVDQDQVDAQYKDGVLKITVPKSEAAKPKKISVHA